MCSATAIATSRRSHRGPSPCPRTGPGARRCASREAAAVCCPGHPATGVCTTAEHGLARLVEGRHPIARHFLLALLRLQSHEPHLVVQHALTHAQHRQVRLTVGAVHKSAVSTPRSNTRG